MPACVRKILLLEDKGERCPASTPPAQQGGVISQAMETPGPCLRGLFDKDDDNVHPLVNNGIFKACPAGMRFDTKEVRRRVFI